MKVSGTGGGGKWDSSPLSTQARSLERGGGDCLPHTKTRSASSGSPSQGIFFMLARLPKVNLCLSTSLRARSGLHMCNCQQTWEKSEMAHLLKYFHHQLQDVDMNSFLTTSLIRQWTAKCTSPRWHFGNPRCCALVKVCGTLARTYLPISHDPGCSFPLIPWFTDRAQDKRLSVILIALENKKACCGFKTCRSRKLDSNPWPQAPIKSLVKMSTKAHQGVLWGGLQLGKAKCFIFTKSLDWKCYTWVATKRECEPKGSSERVSSQPSCLMMHNTKRKPSSHK